MKPTCKNVYFCIPRIDLSLPLSSFRVASIASAYDLIIKDWVKGSLDKNVSFPEVPLLKLNNIPFE
ncbi:MAG: hypothetical protein WDA59_02070 [Methanofastidiosum sp.]